MRTRRGIAAGAAVVGIVLAFGWIVSLATTRVFNWFVMTDELFYVRLAVSVAQTGSPLPRIHGELVANVNQLYPLLLSPFFGNGDVPASMAAAHRLNAFVMVSAAIPVFLLARHTGVGRVGSVWVAALAATVPWVVLSSFLLTEVVAYPAFCWALLALCVAVTRCSARGDLLALAGIALAVLARTQFVVLLPVLAFAVVADASLRREPRSLLRRHVLLAAVGLALAALLVFALRGEASRLLGSYSVTAQDVTVDLGLLRLTLEHVAVLALSLAILPFLLGVAWLVDRVRPSAPPPARALALVGCAALLLVTVQVASFNQRFGGELIKDRYLFYVVPLVLVAVAAALGSRPWPRWWAYLVPAVPAVAGYATLDLPRYEKLNVDSVIAMLNDGLVRAATTEGFAQATLLLATVVAAGLLIQATIFLPRRAVAVFVVALLTFALPAQLAYMFERLFRVDGTNGLPITLDQGVVFNWIDRQLGPDGRVTMFRFPVNSPDYWAGVAYWWDVEFWNETVVQNPELGRGSRTAEPWAPEFDPETGAALRLTETDYALSHGSDARFRLAGTQVYFDRGAYLLRTERPWRAAWLARGIYGDGWTRPDTPAVITVFSFPDQELARLRFVTLSLASADPEADRVVTVSSNLDRWEGAIPAGESVEHIVPVCVEPGGRGEVEVMAQGVSEIYRDPSRAPLTGEIDRPVGVLLRSVALADEAEPRGPCPT